MLAEAEIDGQPAEEGSGGRCSPLFHSLSPAENLGNFRNRQIEPGAAFAKIDKVVGAVEAGGGLVLSIYNKNGGGEVCLTVCCMAS